MRRRAAGYLFAAVRRSGYRAGTSRRNIRARRLAPLALAALTAGLFAAARPAQAWLCSPEDTPEAEARRAALFSQFKDNYFISGGPWGATNSDPRHYVKFQFSIKFNLIPTTSRCTLFFAFTQKSLWKLWTVSPAFEDSNYNPAFFLAWRDHDFTSQLPWQARGARWLAVFAGYEHESNGRGYPDSRGWDRLSAFARVGYYFGDGFLGGGWNLVVQPKAWYPFIPADVPQDLLDYLGYGEVSIQLARESVARGPVDADGSRYVYRDLALGALGRAGKKLDRGYIEAWLRWRPFNFNWISWSLFAQFATGYGETLARYNEKLPPTIRLGIALDDRISTDPQASRPR